MLLETFVRSAIRHFWVCFLPLNLAYRIVYIKEKEALFVVHCKYDERKESKYKIM